MELEFLTPSAAAVAVLGVLPLVALVVARRRSARVRAVLGLEPPRRGAAPLAPVALAAVAALVGLAAAQPVLSSTEARPVRTDAQAFFVLDTSRSMLAAPGAGARTRLQRAKRIAERLRAEVPAVPAGLASLTDRVLPHLFPSPDDAAFVSTLERGIAVDRPPPVNLATRVTTFDPLVALGEANFFPAGIGTRVVVVLTDGEAIESDVLALQQALAPEDGYRVLFVRVWRDGDRIWNGGRVEAQYAPDPESGRRLRQLAGAIGAQAFDEGQAGTAADALRAAAGEGESVVRARREERLAVAPYAVAAAFAPLLLLLWSRNRA